MSPKMKYLLVAYLLVSTITFSEGAWMTCTAIRAAGTVVGAPVVISTLGFGSAGITSGSIAASIQTAIYGGAVPAGGLFATLQAVGAAGMSTLGYLGLGSVGGAFTYIGGKLVSFTGKFGETLTYICEELP